MKKKILLTVALIMFAAGFALYLYPGIVNYFYDRAASRQLSQFSERIGSDRGLLDALYADMIRYNEEIYNRKQDRLVDPFSYSQPSIDLSGYGIADNCVGFLSIEKINVTVPVFLGANNENMRDGAAHLTETSYPVGGDNTNAVIAAHRGNVKNMFRNIHLLEPGDLVIMQNFREVLAYRVWKTKLIDPDDVGELFIQEGRDLITLISCHPPGHNYQRYVVYCERNAG